MELTKEEVQRVEHYLNVKRITYIDIRMEVLDHIISDIEAKMKKEDLDFETVFYNVTDKWNKHLKDTSSWLFGLTYSAPKIVMDKAKKSYKKLFLVSSFLMILLMYFESKVKFLVSVNTQVYITNTLLIINIFCILFYAFLIMKNSNIKQKTTYSFLLNTQKTAILLGFIAIIFSGIIENVTPIYNLTLMFVVLSYGYFYFYKKHLETIKKYKIS